MIPAIKYNTAKLMLNAAKPKHVLFTVNISLKKPPKIGPITKAHWIIPCTRVAVSIYNC